MFQCFTANRRVRRKMDRLPIEPDVRASIEGGVVSGEIFLVDELGRNERNVRFFNIVGYWYSCTFLPTSFTKRGRLVQLQHEQQEVNPVLRNTSKPI